jgi:NADP-dependent aldehyde dehydrogenase
MFAASVTLGVGQFCTNPGLVIGIDGDELQQFIAAAGAEISNFTPSKMLHPGIAKSYAENKATALAQHDVTLVAESAIAAREDCGAATLATVTAKEFLSNALLHQEVFGPYSLIVRCDDTSEMIEVAKHLEGQLTCTLMATENELEHNGDLIDVLGNICGRLIFNGVPTGVEVCSSMQHGGPFPATTDARFTSVGADGIRRFVRPIAFQNWPDRFLPDELKNDNPLNIYRTVNNELTR